MILTSEIPTVFTPQRNHSGDSWQQPYDDSADIKRQTFNKHRYNFKKNDNEKIKTSSTDDH